MLYRPKQTGDSRELAARTDQVRLPKEERQNPEMDHDPTGNHHPPADYNRHPGAYHPSQAHGPYQHDQPDILVPSNMVQAIIFP